MPVDDLELVGPRRALPGLAVRGDVATIRARSHDAIEVTSPMVDQRRGDVVVGIDDLAGDTRDRRGDDLDVVGVKGRRQTALNREAYARHPGPDKVGLPADDHVGRLCRRKPGVGYQDVDAAEAKLHGYQ
ncbi:MAG: hypothetical protein DRP42_00610 [Tenericutes bacterium]|nr:MAG: hypothetical protein DRP42_00610 [Mycoplasmatota bacterium]